MPILGSSNSAKKYGKMGYNYLIEKKTLWDKGKLLVTSNFFFSHNVFKSCLLVMCQNEYLWSKGLIQVVSNKGLTVVEVLISYTI